MFDWVLALIAEAGLVKGERIGVDASTMDNAALRNIVEERLLTRRYLCGEAKIARIPGLQAEHAVDLDTGAVVAAELHPADEGDTTTLPKTLAAAEANLEAVDVAPTAEDPAECVTDKGYHSRLVLKALDDGPWKSRISEPKQKGFARWHGDDAARRAVKCNWRRIVDYPNLWGYLRDLGAGTPKEAYQQPFRSSSSSPRMAKPPSPRYASPWRETRSMTPFSTGCYTKAHYYGSHVSVNPFGVIPVGPEIDLDAPHERAHLG